jgi:hypothetical protein
LHTACSSSERVSFRQINRETGNRLRQQLIDEETRCGQMSKTIAHFPLDLLREESVSGSPGPRLIT